MSTPPLSSFRHIQSCSKANSVKVSNQISDLPDELIIYLFCYLTLSEVAACSLMSKKWYTLAKEEIVWQCLIKRCNWLFPTQTTQSKELLRKGYDLERIAIMDNYDPGLINALGGIDAILKLPYFHLTCIQKRDLRICEAITLSDVTAPIMRGRYNGQHFVTFTLSLFSNNSLYEDILTVFQESKGWWMTKGDGAKPSLFEKNVNREWDVLAKLIKEEKYVEEGQTFRLAIPKREIALENK